jgi:hypothetical protein
MRTEARAIGSLLVATATVGCGASQISPPVPEPTEAVRPSVPDAWSTITSDERDVEVAVPPDFVVLSSIGGVLTQPPIDGQAAVSTLEIFVQGPALIEQPRGGESAEEWLGRTGWLPRSGTGGVTAIADRTERELILPSGRAVQVAVTVQPGTADESRVAVYAIETADGVAVLRFIGFPPERLAARSDELSLVATLVRFGADVGD